MLQLNELSAKADNIKHQLNSRIDKEEEERYMAIKELQEAVSQMQTSGATGPGKDAAPVRLIIIVINMHFSKTFILVVCLVKGKIPRSKLSMITSLCANF